MPSGREVVVIFNGDCAALIVIERGCVSDRDAASVTLTVKFAVPAVVGLPEMTPAELSVRFAGSDPLERLQVRAPVPPVACTVWLYA